MGSAAPAAVSPTGATIPVRRPIAPDDARQVLARYAVGSLRSGPRPAGGTANTNCLLETDCGPFVLRRRNPKYAVHAYVAFDHRLMEHLASHGVPTPLAVPDRLGNRWTVLDGDTYELFEFRPGAPHRRGSIEEIRAAGAALARYHQAASTFDPPPGKAWPRYDDPKQIRVAVVEMLDGLASALPVGGLAYLDAQVALIERELPDERYASLPSHVIHGDFHPANVTFAAGAVAGIYDLDWATVQPRAHDLADGLIFFAGVRDGDVDSSDIRKLTRTWMPSRERSTAFLEGYAECGSVIQEELELLPLFMRARWLYCRAIGRSKVPPEEGVAFFVNGLLEPLRALDAQIPNLIPHGSPR